MFRDATQEYLNSSQSTRGGILKYEFVFSTGFISPDGMQSTCILFAHQHFDPALSHNNKVLDVGCSFGGGCKYLNKQLAYM
ncbi:hypothetical protein EON65_57950 [archaeon]|nr:MAG: hypothetical protein EON65_57950 [archaeon]